jgi:hypothetical protein
MNLKALRISQNGKAGTIFQADGNRAKQLIAAGIAEIYKAPAAKVDDFDPDLDGPIDDVKGGPKPSDARKKKGKK